MPRNKQFDREEVLQKAMELFWKNGYHATSMQDLVDHLGINRASMYNTFGGKEKLFLEAFRLYQKMGSNYFKNFEGILQRKKVRAFLEDFFKGELKAVKKDKDRKGCMVVNVATELSNQSEAVYQLVQLNMENFVELFSRIIQIGQNGGEIDDTIPAEVLARKLFTFYNGVKVLAKIEPDVKKLEEVVGLELDFLFAGTEK